MIFVTLGSREYQFNRLLEEIDRLIENGEIKEEVIAQIGQSTYIPKYYKSIKFMSHTEFGEMQQAANLIITHAGTGAMIGAIKKDKKVIAVPRLSRFGEHIDDHQLQVAKILHDQNYLINVEDMNKLGTEIKKVNNESKFEKYNSKNEIHSILKRFIVST